MTPHDFACLHRRGYVVVNRDGSTYNSDLLLAAFYLAAVGLALWFKLMDARKRTRIIQLPLFDMEGRKSA